MKDNTRASTCKQTLMPTNGEHGCKDSLAHSEDARVDGTFGLRTVANPKLQRTDCPPSQPHVLRVGWFCQADGSAIGNIHVLSRNGQPLSGGSIFGSHRKPLDPGQHTVCVCMKKEGTKKRKNKTKKTASGLALWDI